MQFRENGRAIGAMMLAMAGFILNDTMVKLASDSLPLGQIILVRGLIGTVLMAFACQVTGVFKEISTLWRGAVAWRMVGEVAATVFYLTALIRLPIANATAILQALPLVVTAGAAVVFRDRVGWRRWTAIAVGFSGVLLIVRPGLEGFNVYALFAVAGMLFMALRDLATRGLPKETPTLGVALLTTMAVSVLGAVLTGVQGWQPMDLRAWVFLTLAAVFIMVGYIFIIAALRSGDIAVVAPFRYSIVLWALVLGYIVWGDVPDLLTVLGILVIVGTGIYTFFREQRLARNGR
ncbi:MAG: DMT family transporter [Roseibium sp.]|nr:DMT family transporter [Roseibium sp.]